MTRTTEPTAPSPWRSRIVGSANVAPDQLLANPGNWRTHPSEQRHALSGALTDVGWVAQVMVNRTTGHVVDGHLRLELAITRGEASVPVLYVDLTEDEERLVLASLDPIGAMAEAETNALEELLASLENVDGELRTLLDGLATEHGIQTVHEGLVDPDEVTGLPIEPTVRAGELYALGDHRLLCGDSRDPDHVGKAFGDSGQADLLWTDPPYGVACVERRTSARPLPTTILATGPRPSKPGRRATLRTHRKGCFAIRRRGHQPVALAGT